MITSMIIAAALPDAAELNVESLISDLAFILLLGAVTTVLFKWLRQPVVLGYIVAGFLASPHFAYLPSVTTESNIDFWAQIGIVVLLFSLGLEFSFKKLVNAGGSAIVTALIIICGMMCLGFSIGRLMSFNNINSLFLGGMLSMSSTTIIIKALNDLGLKHRKFAAMVFAVLIVEDLFAVVMMVVLSSIAINNSLEGSQMLMSVSKLVFFLIMWFLVGVFVLPSLLNSTRRFLNTETLLIVSMGLCLGMAVFSVYCGFSLALGAFVMGSILAGTSFAERIENVVTPVKDLFGSVFFISVGMMVDPEIIVEYLGPILLLSGAVIVGMILFGTFGMLVTGQTLKVAIESGFALTQIGEFSFIIATLGMSLGVLDSTIYPIVVAVSVLTTFTTPYFIRLADPTYNFVVKHLPSRLHYLIDRYSKQACAESETTVLWRTMLRRYLWRILLYCMVLIAITLIAVKWMLPALAEWNPVWGRLMCTVLTLVAMSPFLLALSIPASRSTERKRLVAANAHFDVPLIVMTVFRLAVALFFIVYVLAQFYSLRHGVLIGIAIFCMIVFALSKQLRYRMRRIETKFLNNLNERELRRSGRNNNLVSNMHLAFMNVGYGCPFVGERLQDSQLRRKYGANIASIQRGGTVIPVPGPDTRIFPHDVIGVIGTDEDIQKLLPLVEAAGDADDVADDNDAAAIKPDDMKFTSIQLSDSSPLINKTVAQSGIHSECKALLVSIGRDGDFIAPQPDTLLQPHDILWIVGKPALLTQLK